MIEWDNVTEENTHIFIPPIKLGKVIKVESGDTILIASNIHLVEEPQKIFRFTIYLDRISAPKIIPLNENDPGIIARDALSSLLFGKIVELRNVTSDKHGKLYANVFMEDNIHVNEWLLMNNYATKSKNGKKRRMTESDKYSTKINILPNLISNHNSTNSYKTNDFTLPFLRPTTASSSIIQSDCFLSHNWGEKHINHQHVQKINVALQKRGLNTWFDENKLDGNIRYKMAEGIDNTKCVVVFVTKEYRDKVNGLDMKDNCKYEFAYAMNQLGSQNMVSVVMEAEMRETNKWKGELGAALGSMLFVDLSSIENYSEIEIEKKYDELYKRIKHIIHRREK